MLEDFWSVFLDTIGPGMIHSRDCGFFSSFERPHHPFDWFTGASPTVDRGDRDALIHHASVSSSAFPVADYTGGAGRGIIPMTGASSTRSSSFLELGVGAPDRGSYFSPSVALEPGTRTTAYHHNHPPVHEDSLSISSSSNLHSIARTSFFPLTGGMNKCPEDPSDKSHCVIVEFSAAEAKDFLEKTGQTEGGAAVASAGKNCLCIHKWKQFTDAGGHAAKAPTQTSCPAQS